MADHDELPKSFSHTNDNGIPDRAIIGLGICSAVFAVFGNLSSLVQAASLTFLFTFATVNFLAWKEKAGHRFLTGTGAIMAATATISLTVRLFQEQPWSLAAIATTTLIAVFLRPCIIRKAK